MNAITKHLPLIEKIFLAATLIGIILFALKIDTSVIKVALLGLAITFFLFSYRPNESPQPDERFGFQGLLAHVIVPKILWISSAISTLGIAFFLFNFGNGSYRRLLIIGGLTIAVACVILLASLMQGVKYLAATTPLLLRAIPLLVLDFYLLFF